MTTRGPGLSAITVIMLCGIAAVLPDPESFPYTEFEARGVFVDDLFDLVPRIQELLEPVEELLGN